MRKGSFGFWIDLIPKIIFCVGWIISLPVIFYLLIKRPGSEIRFFAFFWIIIGALMFVIVFRRIKKLLKGPGSRA